MTVKRRPLADDDPRHGTANGYNNYGCRCAPCTEAWRITMWTYQHGDPQRPIRHRDRMRARRATQREEPA